jgi:hypothetical protein
MLVWWGKPRYLKSYKPKNGWYRKFNARCFGELPFGNSFLLRNFQNGRIGNVNSRHFGKMTL